MTSAKASSGKGIVIPFPTIPGETTGSCGGYGELRGVAGSCGLLGFGFLLFLVGGGLGGTDGTG